MSAPNKEVFKNNASNTLDGNITNVATSIAVVSGSGFPSTGDFRLLCESEIMLCTARSTNTLTVVRGVEGTSAVAHNSGAVIAHIATSGGMERWVKDYVPFVGSSQPALSRLVSDDGTTILTASDFTAVNAGGSDVVSDQNGTILMRKGAGGGGASVHSLVRSAPSTPYAYIASFEAMTPLGAASGDRPNFGMVFRESSTSKLATFEHSSEGGTGQEPHLWRITNRANNTTALTNQAAARLTMVCPRLWMKIEDDGTNLKYHVSPDGFNWIQLFSQGRTVHMAGGPNQVGWFADNDQNDKEMLVRLCHWSKE